MRIVSSADLVWKGDNLRFQRRKLAAVVRDKKYPTMWRVDYLDGSKSDMVNRDRARDAAISVALAKINRRQPR